MTEQQPGTRLPALLWLVAAALAATAVGIRCVRGGEINWGVGTAGLFCAIMGVITLARSRSASPRV